MNEACDKVKGGKGDLLGIVASEPNEMNLLIGKMNRSYGF